MLIAVDFLQVGPREIVIAGDSGSESVRAMLAEVRGGFLPQRVVALAGPSRDASLIPLIESREAGSNGARAFVCRNYACALPAESARALAEQLADAD
jgi:uncharacterized protein YyaL (SSP411 family)